jgi:hypothetical protein
MDIVQIETPIVIAIVAIQLVVAVRTFLKIEVLKTLMPEVESLKVEKDFHESHDKDISTIKHDKRYGSSTPLERLFTALQLSGVYEKMVKKSNKPTAFDQIKSSLNTYLVRNSTAATDFNLIKDVVERNADKTEEEINLTISVPLYIGLMGTMIGIVIGLFNMSDMQTAVTDESLGSGISTLLGGVKIAMIGSLTGLGLTVLNSGFFFKAAKSQLEQRKNDFYTFIQTELLPVVNQSLNATFDSLQRNLLKFNDTFTYNLDRLAGIFDTNYEALRTQEKVLDMLQNIDLADMAKYNVKVLKQLQLSMEEFEKFTQYLQSMNTFVDKINLLLKRTDNFQTIADNVNTNLSQSKDLMEFLHTHFKALDERKKVIQNAVVVVDNAISDALNELKTHTHNSIENVKKFTIDESDALRQALSDSHTNLSNLAYLENLKKDLGLFKNSSATQGEHLKQQLIAMNTSIEKLVDVSVESNERQKENILKRLFSRSEKTEIN